VSVRFHCISGIFSLRLPHKLVESMCLPFRGGAQFACAKGGASWSGILAPNQQFSQNVEVSFGQRQACNATTKDKQEELQRILVLSKSFPFCRRTLRPECDPQYSQTQSIFNPGIYSPLLQDCVNTTIGFFFSGQNCIFNQSDPYSIMSMSAVRQQMSLDWMKSNEIDPSTGTQASPYTIPVVKEAQVHLKTQCNCMGGCFDSEFAFNGYLGLIVCWFIYRLNSDFFPLQQMI
jgi:hypothetical protein